MFITTYSDLRQALEDAAQDAAETAAQYAEGEEWGESQYHDGRAAGLREALALLRRLEPPDEYQPMDTLDYMGRRL